MKLERLADGPVLAALCRKHPVHPIHVLEAELDVLLPTGGHDSAAEVGVGSAVPVTTVPPLPGSLDRFGRPQVCRSSSCARVVRPVRDHVIGPGTTSRAFRSQAGSEWPPPGGLADPFERFVAIEGGSKAAWSDGNGPR